MSSRSIAAMHLKQSFSYILLILLLLLGVHGIRSPALNNARITSPPLLKPRQALALTCQAGATQCYTDRAGCCDVGTPCSTDASNRLFCAGGTCAGKVNCTGVMLGACCDQGYACDEKNYLCSPTDLATRTGVAPKLVTHVSYYTRTIITETTWDSQIGPSTTSITAETPTAAGISYGPPTIITMTTWHRYVVGVVTETASSGWYPSSAAGSQIVTASALPTSAAAAAASTSVQVIAFIDPTLISRLTHSLT